ncbi:MAG TPA: acyltransferase [Candidatus Thermoplasmatota archaeon]|nr:acyltransferase [Candidatus Thermoplasmatota archaeon]
MLRVLARVLRSPAGGWAWLRSAYLTVRYVDERTSFPAIRLRPGSRLKVQKAPDARLSISGRLVVESFLGQPLPAVLQLNPGSILEVNGTFTIGDDVRIKLEQGARAVFGGAEKENSAGITCRSIVLVRNDLRIGDDVMVSWNTFLTDTDAHAVGSAPSSLPTRIGDHVWIASGAQVLKGASIGDGCVVAAGAVVLGGDYPPRSLLAGVPARIARRGIAAWRR